MNTHDSRLKDLLADRIKNAEMPVPDHLWSGIASRLPETVVSGSAAAGKAGWGIMQWVIAAVTVGAISTGVYFLSQDNQVPAAPVASEPETVAPKQSAVDSNQPEPSGGLVETTAALPQAAEDSDSRSEIKATTSPSSPASASSSAISSTHHVDHLAGGLSAPGHTSASGDPSRTNEPVQGSSPSAAPAPAVEEERITASFSSRQVDAETLRWLFIPQEDDAKSYVWDFGDGSVSENMAGAHSYSEEGTFEVTLTVSDEAGNTQRSTQEIHIVKPVVIRPANIFTPNGDSRNDLFEPLHDASGIDRGQEFVIFDQSNRIVFSSETQFTWDGRTPSGVDCPDATYRFYIKALDNRGNPVEKSGLVRLMR
ncbi:MAG: PKD domain-containing protein [Flavobacteriales bacterium]